MQSDHRGSRETCFVMMLMQEGIHMTVIILWCFMCDEYNSTNDKGFCHWCCCALHVSQFALRDCLK